MIARFAAMTEEERAERFSPFERLAMLPAPKRLAACPFILRMCGTARSVALSRMYVRASASAMRAILGHLPKWIKKRVTSPSFGRIVSARGGEPTFNRFG